jgi:hypothetical protein
VYADDIQFFRDLDMKGNSVKGLKTPTTDADAATKAYVDGAAGVKYDRVLWVSTLNGDDANDGSFAKPVKTLTKAIALTPNNQDQDVIINLMQTMVEGDVEINRGITKITIQGAGAFDSHAILLYSRVKITGANTTRVRIKDLQIRTAGLAGGGVPLTIEGTAGRHKFDNVTLNPASGQKAFVVNGTIPNNFWSEFINCAIMGEMDLDGTLAGAATLTFRSCSDDNMKPNVNSAWSAQHHKGGHGVHQQHC